MKCIDCKWFSGTVNDTYGLCKRYPTAQNKTQHDWCGDYTSKIDEDKPIKIKFVNEEAPQKYGRRAKNAD